MYVYKIKLLTLIEIVEFSIIFVKPICESRYCHKYFLKVKNK